MTAFHFVANGAQLHVFVGYPHTHTAYLLQQGSGLSAQRTGWAGHAYRRHQSGRVISRPIARAVVDNFGQLVEVRP